jgi:hypothetical protein
MIPELRGAAEELQTVRRAEVLLLRAIVLPGPPSLPECVRWLRRATLESLLCLLPLRLVCAGGRGRRDALDGACGAARLHPRRRLPSWLAHRLRAQSLRVRRAH